MGVTRRVLKSSLINWDPIWCSNYHVNFDTSCPATLPSALSRFQPLFNISKSSVIFFLIINLSIHVSFVRLFAHNRHTNMSPVHQVWPKPSCKAQWKGEEDKADRGRRGKTTSGNGVQQVPEGSGEQGKMEKTGCEIICGAPTTLVVKGLMIMMMMRQVTDAFLDSPDSSSK